MRFQSCRLVISQKDEDRILILFEYPVGEHFQFVAYGLEVARQHFTRSVSY